jgi:hypothetical protein
MAAMKTRGHLAAAVLAMHLLVVSLAMSPALHDWLHHDADAQDHQCAVTSMLAGFLDQPAAPDPSAALPAPRVEISLVSEPTQPMTGGPTFRHAGRSPPVA